MTVKPPYQRPDLNEDLEIKIDQICIIKIQYQPQGAEVTGHLRVNGKLQHLWCCTLDDQSLAWESGCNCHRNFFAKPVFGKMT